MRRDLVGRDKGSRPFPFPRSPVERTVWTACDERQRSKNGQRQKIQKRERAARQLGRRWEIEGRIQEHSPSCWCSELRWRETVSTSTVCRSQSTMAVATAPGSGRQEQDSGVAMGCDIPICEARRRFPCRSHVQHGPVSSCQRSCLPAHASRPQRLEQSRLDDPFLLLVGVRGPVIQCSGRDDAPVRPYTGT